MILRRGILVRAALVSGAVTLPLLLMLTVFMPAGFSGVPYIYFVILTFLVSFGLVAGFERSLAVNMTSVLVFWSAILVWHLLRPGTAPGQGARMASGALYIGGASLVHALLQATIWCIRATLRRAP